jgi:hypothetical protein
MESDRSGRLIEAGLLLASEMLSLEGALHRVVDLAMEITDAACGGGRVPRPAHHDAGFGRVTHPGRTYPAPSASRRTVGKIPPWPKIATSAA